MLITRFGIELLVYNIAYRYIILLLMTTGTSELLGGAVTAFGDGCARLLLRFR